jgi:MFS family permease
MKYFVLALLCSVAVIAYVQRLGMQTAYEPLQAELKISTERFGAIGTAWLIGYAILQVPSGWLADRWGSRKALVLYAALWSILTGSIGLTRSFETLIVVWFLMGMAMAGAFPCAAKSLTAWFPDTEKATASGLLGTSMLLGAAAASLLTTWLITEQKWSWQWTYAAYGAAGVVWALFYFAFIPDRQNGQHIAPPMTGAEWRRLLASLPMWLLCGQQFFRAGAMIFFLNWFPKFLRESRRLDAYDAGVYTSQVNAAAMLGGILGGFLSDWLLRRTGRYRLSRQGIAVVGMTACGALIVATYFVSDNAVAIVLFSVGAFMATFGGVSGYTVTIEFGGTRVATVFSIMNMAGNIGGALFNFIAGALQERTGSWDAALLVFAGVFGIDAVCWAWLNPVGPLFPVTGDRVSHEAR